MNRLAIVFALGAAALLGASAASAKGPSQTAVCGKSLDLPTSRACLVIPDSNELVYQLLDQSESFSLAGRPRPAPFYKVAFRVPEPGGSRWNWSYLYVPSRGLIRVTTSGGLSTYWRSAPTTVTQAFETLSKRLRPFSAPRRWR